MTEQAKPWDFVYQEAGVTLPPFDEQPLSVYVQEHAHAIPDFPALKFYSKSITYAELDRLANQLANVLIDLGVEKQDVVGFHMPNIPQYVIAVLAVAKIGCAGSGVSPLLTPSELAYQIEDASISTLISLDALANSSLAGIENMPSCLTTVLVCGATDYLAPAELTLPTLDNVNVMPLLAQMAAASDQFEQREVHWNDTFLIQYTGGTTGKPKGAMLSVRNIVRCAATQYALQPLNPGEETFLTPFPMFHIAGIGGVVSGLRYGGCGILVPDPRDLDYICDQLMANPPSYFGAVPTLFQMLLQHEKFKKIDWSKLKMAISGAAPLTADDRRKIEQVIGENKICDAFGMTETSPVYVVNPCTRIKPSALGIPVPGADVKIVDVETGTQEMPVGEPGEIITAGPHVMKGYLNLPEESAKAMREFDGKTWMYTGDVGFIDEEGYISISDRAKDMLIVGGFKVFSVEVEDKLNSLDFVANSAIIGEPDAARPGNDLVNVFVELSPQSQDRDKGELESQLMAFCRKNLSPYKVPKVVHFIDAIPLTAVGKIDKKLLRDQLSQKQA
ncbi:class I adenylate-forming enzyme family protein [Arenicella xantha]|uniref:Long-chain acyl-CoA synthetase n=1 Tax=Arenicella xantha TaxID=644221 RepID=A0A395JM80_9GAMM|nr:AMP-binding protein [Arenicella xantha]RBP52720.1 long-chain acyl-CoA synthetase [Arenicella xantha]